MKESSNEQIDPTFLILFLIVLETITFCSKSHFVPNPFVTLILEEYLPLSLEFEEYVPLHELSNHHHAKDH